ncbi:MAG: phosphoglycerate mutase family protein [Planctomycetota bacterium]|nr:phosphoglycerate mutase family protein [Planctomycetota bacterium]
MKSRTRLAVLALLVPLGLLAAQSVAPVTADGQKPVTVFLVRHAEKATSPESDRDPELSEAGAKRAAHLARLLSKAGVTHLYASEYRRTQATLAPLAKKVGIELEVVSARSPGAQTEALVDLPPGSVAVVAGHSNTVPRLVEALGGEVRELADASLGHDEYDRLFVVTLPAGEGAATQTIELRYGE